MANGAGTGTLSFGAAPNSRAVTVITGQTEITADSLVECWITYASTASNSADNHALIASMSGVTSGSIVPGTGFTAVAIVSQPVTGDIAFNWCWSTLP